MKAVAFFLVFFLCFPVFSLGAEDTITFVAKPAGRTVVVSGFTRARARMVVSSEVDGRCLEVVADVGDEIGTDGRFAEIDPTFINLDLERNRISTEQSASLIAYLQKEVGRYQTLYAEQSASEARLDKLKEDLAQARFTLQTQQNTRQTLLEQLRRHTVIAPPGWKVVERHVEPGVLVSRGQSLAEVADYQKLVVPLALSPHEYQQLLKNETPFSVSLPDTGINVSAELFRISPSFDPSTRKINIELSLLESIEQQRGGVRVELSLLMPEKETFLVPARAVEKRYEEYRLIRESGESVTVVVLEKNGDFVRVHGPEIKDGQRFLFPATIPAPPSDKLPQ